MHNCSSTEEKSDLSDLPIKSVLVHVYETTCQRLFNIGVADSLESKSPFKLFNPCNPSSMHSMCQFFLLCTTTVMNLTVLLITHFYTFFSCRMQPFYMALEWFTSITMHFNGEYIYLKHYVLSLYLCPLDWMGIAWTWHFYFYFISMVFFFNCVSWSTRHVMHCVLPEIPEAVIKFEYENNISFLDG